MEFNNQISGVWPTAWQTEADYRKFAVDQAVKLMVSGNAFQSVISMAQAIGEYLNGK